jgi:hypothetical protein
VIEDRAANGAVRACTCRDGQCFASDARFSDKDRCADGGRAREVDGRGKYTATASGIFMVLVCGGGILPLIQGAVADATSSLASFWVIFLGMAYLLYYALIGSKNVNKDIPVE